MTRDREYWEISLASEIRKGRIRLGHRFRIKKIMALGLLAIAWGALVSHQPPSRPAHALSPSVRPVEIVLASDLPLVNGLRIFPRASRSRRMALPDRPHRAAQIGLQVRHTVTATRPRIKVQVTTVTGPSSFWTWRTSHAATVISACESAGNIAAIGGGGTYRGKWQMDADFWRSYGGLAFAGSPEVASELQQDLVAYKGYQQRGWQPWECARITGMT